VPALARAAHLSPAHFSREFRRTFGETPHQYLLTRRLERAAALLRTTDHTVLEVCLDVRLEHPPPALGHRADLRGAPARLSAPPPAPAARPRRIFAEPPTEQRSSTCRRSSTTPRPATTTLP